MKSWIRGIPLALAVLLAVGTQSASAELRIRTISPNPMVIERPVTLEGTGFGEPGERHLFYGAYGALGGAPAGDLGATAVRSWSDTRIVLDIPIRVEGRYWLRIATLPGAEEATPRPGVVELSGVVEHGISFDAVLPTPTISRYSPSAVCPGGNFSIHGNGFGRRSGMFTILWDKIGEGRDYSVSIRDGALLGWTNSEIRFRLPNDLPAYISPGDRFRIRLGKPSDGRALTVVARGPDGRLGENCDIHQAITPGRTPQIGPPRAVSFKLAPLRGIATVGDKIFFGGTFTASPELQSRLRSSPLSIDWKIVRQGESRAAATGRVELRGRRTPLLVNAVAPRAGTYHLELTMVDRPRDVRFRPDLSTARIQVNAKLRGEQIDPKMMKKLPKGLPAGTKPRKLELPAAP